MTGVGAQVGSVEAEVEVEIGDGGDDGGGDAPDNAQEERGSSGVIKESGPHEVYATNLMAWGTSVR